MKHPSENKIIAIGTMSGTSLDGLDVVAVEFKNFNGNWKFNLLESSTFSYSAEWQNKLMNAPTLSGLELIILNAEYGGLIADKILGFLKEKKINPHLIASHGHTVFHQPEKRITLQIGNGAEIASKTGITTVSDFRSFDVALGGQGAPLVPVGDKFLFGKYDYCLNLGGFSNISFDKNGKRLAFDICPVNIILNRYAEKHGQAYDKNGELGRKGEIHIPLLNALNELPYYHEHPPKSLGREWLEQHLIPVLEKYHIPETDTIRTLYEHIAVQISDSVADSQKLLITGGGAHNKFLIERIKKRSKAAVIIPETKIIDYKEALIFAFLGVLRLKNEVNCFASVTGASRDSSGGVIFNPS